MLFNKRDESRRYSGKFGAARPRRVKGLRADCKTREGVVMAERPYVPFASTDPMRKRLRELADPDLDDFDRAVVIVLDDFERLLAWYEAARMDSNEELVAVRGLVEQQANDEGLWFVA